MKDEKKIKQKDIKKDSGIRVIKRKIIPQADIEMLREDRYESKMNGDDSYEK